MVESVDLAAARPVVWSRRSSLADPFPPRVDSGQRGALDRPRGRDLSWAAARWCVDRGGRCRERARGRQAADVGIDGSRAGAASPGGDQNRAGVPAGSEQLRARDVGGVPCTCVGPRGGVDRRTARLLGSAILPCSGARIEPRPCAARRPPCCSPSRPTHSGRPSRPPHQDPQPELASGGGKHRRDGITRPPRCMDLAAGPADDITPRGCGIASPAAPGRPARAPAGQRGDVPAGRDAGR